GAGLHQVGLLAGHRVHELPLVDRRQQRGAQLGIVERGKNWLKRMMPSTPSGSLMAMTTPGDFFSIGSRSISGHSTQSTSPLCNAAEAVAGSGITCHST